MKKESILNLVVRLHDVREQIKDLVKDCAIWYSKTGFGETATIEFTYIEGCKTEIKFRENDSDLKRTVNITALESIVEYLKK